MGNYEEKSAHTIISQRKSSKKTQFSYKFTVRRSFNAMATTMATDYALLHKKASSEKKIGENDAKAWLKLLVVSVLSAYESEETSKQSIENITKIRIHRLYKSNNSSNGNLEKSRGCKRQNGEKRRL